MRYVLTQRNLDLPENCQSCTQSFLLDYLDRTEMISVDTETTGLDCHIDKLLSIQIGDSTDQFLIDCTTINPYFLKPYLESKLIVGQNWKFDAKFFYKIGIYVNRIYDTFVSEKVITCGDKTARAALDYLTDKYCRVTLDKSIRADIHKEGLSSRVIDYALDDVKYLIDIKNGQFITLEKEDLIGTSNIENRFTPCLAYIEYCGFKLDADKWAEKMEKDMLLYKEQEAKLNEWVLSRNLPGFITSQLDLFSPISCAVQWSSPKQVIKLFESQGLNCSIMDKGVAKKSVEASNLSKYKGNELIELYIAYKKAEKVITTYGQSFIDQIHPRTGRLHTKFTQILDTGRISSGGKDRIAKIDTINFQNIPSDKETRACFVADKGNTLIIADYSGQEQIILANRSMDENLLRFYDEGLADMHSFVASKMYPELDGMPVDEIKEKHKDKRYNAKTAGFAINYGGVGATISANNNLSIEEGEHIYNAYFTAFPGLKSYFDQVKKQGLKDGFILINKITRRKSYIMFYHRYKELETEIDNKQFWTMYRTLKPTGSEKFLEMKHKVKDFFKYKGEIERMSLNFPIQGSAADITKISCVYIFDKILEEKMFGIVLFVNTIHDENVLEVPATLAEEWSGIAKDCMEKAGAIYCKRVALTTDPEVNFFWKK